MYQIMRNIPYTWEEMLEELVPRTIITLDLINKEKQREAKAYEKAKRRGKK